MTTDQMNNFRRICADTYREKHGLLTSSQIITYREELGMSQSMFARYLSVGEASIKRWETYYVQDASQDELMRLKCDDASAEMNFLAVHRKKIPEDLFNGKRKFNFQIMKNVILYLTKHLKTSKLFLNKVLFYTDFLHFKHYGISLTGARYTPLKYGPCPDQYQTIYNLLINKGFLKESKNRNYECLEEPELNLFDDNEIKTLENIVSICKKLGIKKIYDLSHQEKGYIETDECSFITYEFAKELLI
jgi:DNA-binding transcriptional regulator YiaG